MGNQVSFTSEPRIEDTVIGILVLYCGALSLGIYKFQRLMFVSNVELI